VEDLGALKGNRGDQQDTVPPGLDTERYDTAVIWCRAFSVNFAAADLERPCPRVSTVTPPLAGTLPRPYGAGVRRAPADVSTTAGDDDALLQALARGDEAAFAALLDRYSGPLRRVVRAYVSSEALADEVVQETWLGVLTGLERFERRASLRTWIFRIAINQAKTKGQRERRSVPFSAIEDSGPGVDPDRLQPPEGRWPDHWATASRPWEDPERRLLALEGRQRLRDALDLLPETQRMVVTLRDVEGLSATEVCVLLEITEINQRVLLHRGRARLRRELERYLAA
jgi:RNA polymerase sigma-70 factor (ECF subfamily)